MNIKQAKENFEFFNEGDYITKEMVKSKDILLAYIEKLENEINNKDKEDLCNECSSIAKEVSFTKEDLDKIIAETREIQRKADKYDLLVEKLKEMRIALNKDGFVGYADEITDILAEVEEE